MIKPRDILQFAGGLIPFLTVSVVVLLSSVSLYAPHIGEVLPRFVVAAVVYWAVFRPDLFGHGSAFATGILFDLVAGLPLGLTSLGLLLVRAGVLKYRRFFLRRRFVIVWFLFAVTALAFSAFEWLVGSLYLFHLRDPVPSVLQFVFLACGFPFIYWALMPAQEFVSRFVWNSSLRRTG